MVHTAESAARAAQYAPYLWVRQADAARLTLPAPWVTGPVDKVNGEDAVLLKHPARERAVVRYMDGDLMTAIEMLYVARVLYAHPAALFRKALLSRGPKRRRR